MTTQDAELRRILVRDVMQEHVVSIPLHATMTEAAAVLCGHDISGAPVVDERGRCVGVISARDFAKREQSKECEGLNLHRGSEFAMAHDQFRGPMQIHYAPEDSVESHMTPAAQTVDASQSILDAARCMSEGHLSRLVVVDAQSRPVGIVGALDLLATWVRQSDGC